MTNNHDFGVADSTYRAAGQEQGVRKLVASFFEIMSTDPAYKRIWSWHTEELEVAADKLASFLCGWMGGPRFYQDKFGGISIPRVHSHLNVTEIERDQWLSCMRKALARQHYPEELVEYLMIQLAKPAEMIRLTPKDGPQLA